MCQIGSQLRFVLDVCRFQLVTVSMTNNAHNRSSDFRGLDKPAYFNTKFLPFLDSSPSCERNWFPYATRRWQIRANCSYQMTDRVSITSVFAKGKDLT